MKTIGIIAEYNPFHNGHKYQIEEAKRITGADFVIVIMSGDFVQRGTPAIADKYIRTKMALNSGADVVFELPVLYATSSAELFALGAVSLLDGLSCIDYLCFGTECGDINMLSEIADVFIKEPLPYRRILKNKLKKGYTFPSAREFALFSYFTDIKSYENLEIVKNIITMPNNILGFEYIKALIKIKSNIKPITIKRCGSGYHDDHITDNTFSSATAIRSYIENMYSGIVIPSINDFEDSLSSSMSKENINLLYEQLNISLPITADDTSFLLRYLLRTLTKEKADTISDFSEDLFNKIKKADDIPFSFTELTIYLKSKQYTFSRIQRTLLHLLLDITYEDINPLFYDNNEKYIRLLGFNKKSAPLLRYIQDNSKVKIITKPADAKSVLSPYIYSMFCKDIFASRLYSDLIKNKFSKDIIDEYKRPMIIL